MNSSFKDFLCLELTKPTVVVLTSLSEIQDFPEKIEIAGRTCYKSEEKITEKSKYLFVQKILDSGHESVLEHCSITVRFVGTRSMSHQLVRHRIGAYSQESQRYCNYGKSDALVVIPPPSVQDFVTVNRGARIFCSPFGLGETVADIYYVEHQCDGQDVDIKKIPRGSLFWDWAFSTLIAYFSYKKLLASRVRPEDAREVLPNCTKTEVVTTYNLRQWRHFFKLRCDKHAQWQIRELAMDCLRIFGNNLPSVFGDIADIYGLIEER